MFYFHPYLGKIPNLTHIFQMGWFNHQLDKDPVFKQPVFPGKSPGPRCLFVAKRRPNLWQNLRFAESLGIARVGYGLNLLGAVGDMVLGCPRKLVNG